MKEPGLYDFFFKTYGQNTDFLRAYIGSQKTSHYCLFRPLHVSLDRDIVSSDRGTLAHDASKMARKGKYFFPFLLERSSQIFLKISSVQKVDDIMSKKW